MGIKLASPPHKMRKRDVTRRRIAEESLRLYEAHGYAETTLAQISKAAGISARTLYLHFATKEDTLRYWREEGFLDDFPGVMEHLAAQTSPLATAQAGIAALIALQDPSHSARVDRLLESSDALWANKQAIFVQFERILHEWLCRHWPNEGCAAMQTVAMIATGTMRLAMDHWRKDGSVRPIGAYLDEEFEKLGHVLGHDQGEMNMTDPVKVVEDFVVAVTKGDMVAATAILSDDFVLHHTTRLPYRGVYHGRAGFVELLEKIGAYWDSFEPTPGQQMVRDGDGVVVVGELCGKPRHYDKKIAIRVVERYAVKDGHITTIWPFYIDTHLTEEQVSP